MIYTFVPWYEKTIPDPILGHKIYLCLAGAVDWKFYLRYVARSGLQVAIPSIAINLNYINVHCIKTISNDCFLHRLCVSLCFFYGIFYFYNSKIKQLSLST